MGKQCRTCVFNTKKESCRILNERIEKDCWAWADEKEKKRREEAIKEYAKRFELKGMSQYNTSRDKLDAKFMELYQQGYHDTDIAKKLGIHASTVGDYRRNLKLPYHNKRKKPAATGK